MAVFYIMGFVLHFLCIYQSQQNGAWLFFVDGQFHFSFNLPIALCTAALLIDHFTTKRDDFQSSSPKWVSVLLVTLNLGALILSYHYYAHLSIPVTFVGQSLFISTSFMVLAFES